MVRHFDHVTVVVRDIDRARAFFTLLGFEEDKAVVIAGPTFERYMGVPGIEAEHVTLVLAKATPRCEVQLLDAAKVAQLRAHGIRTCNEIMDFHLRKLVFLVGPEGITVELSQWHV